MVKQAPSQGPRSGCLGPLRGLHDLRPLAREVHLCWKVLRDTAKGLRDEELESMGEPRGDRTDRRIARLRTRIDQAAPRVLIVPR